jgi:hypothetical protein
MPNYTYHPRKLSDDDINEVVRLYKTGGKSVTTKTLATKYSCSAATIANYLRSLISPDEYRRLRLLRNPTYPGAEVVQSKRDRRHAFWNRVNHSAFSDLGAEQAYWVGFLLADGCVYKNRIQLGLCKRDKHQVEKFRDFVDGGFYKIGFTKSNNSCSLKFVSQQMAADLSVYGVVPRKSLTDNFGLNIPDNLLSHYVRGIFDGDGSVHMDQRSSVVVQMPGSYKFCQNLLGSLKIYGIRGIGPYIRQNTKMCSVQINSDNGMQFLRWIYAESSPETRLDRKFEKWLTLKS